MNQDQNNSAACRAGFIGDREILAPSIERAWDESNRDNSAGFLHSGLFLRDMAWTARHLVFGRRLGRFGQGRSSSAGRSIMEMSSDLDHNKGEGIPFFIGRIHR